MRAWKNGKYYDTLKKEQKKGLVGKMSPIICAAEKIKAYEALEMLCEYAGKSAQWRDELWIMILTDYELYGEFLYYLEHHSFADRMKTLGYSLTDCYVWQIERDNLAKDTGKNTESCNKEEMVLEAFWTMAQMKKNPDYYRRKLSEGAGMDRE